MGLSQISAFLNSLTFGGLIGIGIGILLFLYVPVIANTFHPVAFVLFCGALGGAIHNLVARIFKWIFSPIIKTIEESLSMIKAYILFRGGIIDEAKKDEIWESIINRSFGIDTEKQKNLSPAKEDITLNIYRIGDSRILHASLHCPSDQTSFINLLKEKIYERRKPSEKPPKQLDK